MSFQDFVKRAYYQYYFEFNISTEKMSDWVKPLGLFNVVRGLVIKALSLRYNLISVEIRDKGNADELVLKYDEDIEVKILTPLIGDIAVHISSKNNAYVEHVKETIFAELNRIIKKEGEEQ